MVRRPPPDRRRRHQHVDRREGRPPGRARPPAAGSSSRSAAPRSWAPPCSPPAAATTTAAPAAPPRRPPTGEHRREDDEHGPGPGPHRGLAREAGRRHLPDRHRLRPGDHDGHRRRRRRSSSRTTRPTSTPSTAPISDAGGEEVTEPNEAVFEALIKPARRRRPTTEADIVQIAFDLENAAAQTYVFAGGTLSVPALRSTIMTIGGIEARHAAVLQVAAQGAVARSTCSPASGRSSPATTRSPTSTARCSPRSRTPTQASPWARGAGPSGPAPLAFAGAGSGHWWGR